MSISYALGAILGGAFSPLIAQALVQATGGTTAVAVYLVGMAALGILATSLLRDRRGIDLGIDNQAAQEQGATILERARPSADRAEVPAVP